MDDFKEQGVHFLRVASFWRRVGMRLLDIIIGVVPCVILYRYSLKLSIGMGSVTPFVLYWILFCVALSFFIVKYGGTPGKLIMKAKIVHKNGNLLSVFNSILRITFYIVSAGCLILLLNEAIHLQIQEDNIVHFIGNHSSQYRTIYTFSGLLAILSDLFVFFNHNRRALHDYIAGSYVIDNSTLEHSVKKTVDG